MVCLSTHKSLKSTEKSKNKINLQNNRILTNPSLKYFLLPDVFLFLGQPNTLASRQKQTGFETDFQKPSPEVAKDLAQLDEARVKLSSSSLTPDPLLVQKKVNKEAGTLQVSEV